jgi:MFS family permease
VPEARSRHRLVAAALAAALMPLNSTMIAVALPQISDDFDQDPALVTQTLVTSYLIAAVVLQSPAGKIGDRIGHSRMLAIGQVLVGIGALLGYLGPSLWLLATARVLMAAGGAVLVPATVALLRQELPLERRGRAFGAFGAVMGLAAALGPLVGGELVKAFGWPSVFAANLPVLAVSAALGALAGPVAGRAERAVQPSFDWLGSGLLAAALTLVIIGLRPDVDQAVVLLLVGVALFVPFVLRERRATEPVVAFSLFGSVPFSAGTLLIAVQNLVMYALLFEIPLIAKALFDLQARDTGRLLVSLMLAMVVTSPVAGRLADRLGARVLAVAGSIVALVGVVALAWIDLATPAALAVPLALLGVGLGMATPAAQSASMSAAPADLAGMAAGVASTMRYLGGIAGIAVLGLVLDVGGPRADVVSEHRTLMVFFAGALIVGLLCAALLPGLGPAGSRGLRRERTAGPPR